MDYNKLLKEVSRAVKENISEEKIYIERDIVDFPKLKWLQNYMIGHNGYIAGGCFKNVINGEDVKDIDIFFTNEKEQIKAKMYYSDNKDYVKAYNNDKVDASACSSFDLELHDKALDVMESMQMDIINR